MYDQFLTVHHNSNTLDIFRFFFIYTIEQINEVKSYISFQRIPRLHTNSVTLYDECNFVFAHIPLPSLLNSIKHFLIIAPCEMSDRVLLFLSFKFLCISVYVCRGEGKVDQI